MSSLKPPKEPCLGVESPTTDGVLMCRWPILIGQRGTRCKEMMACNHPATCEVIIDIQKWCAHPPSQLMWLHYITVQLHLLIRPTEEEEDRQPQVDAPMRTLSCSIQACSSFYWTGALSATTSQKQRHGKREQAAAWDGFGTRWVSKFSSFSWLIKLAGSAIIILPPSLSSPSLKVFHAQPSLTSGTAVHMPTLTWLFSLSQPPSHQAKPLLPSQPHVTSPHHTHPLMQA